MTLVIHHPFVIDRTPHARFASIHSHDTVDIEDDLPLADIAKKLQEHRQVVVSVARWLREQNDLMQHYPGKIGVLLQPDDDPAKLLDADGKIPVDRIAIAFPAFKFGQGYSSATLLRKRYGYQGALRAQGDIWRDQLFYLARVGFDEFVIKPGKSVEDAILGFSDFSVTYQDSANQSAPLFRRVARGA